MTAAASNTEWVDRARNRARVLAEQVEVGYLELGEILYRIYDAPVDGDVSKGPVLTTWGYKNVGEFAERELGIHNQKAKRLIRLFYRIHVELGGIDNGPLLTRFRRVGWTKARELIRVITKDTAEFWISKAEQVNYTTLYQIIKQTIDRAEQAKIKAELAKQPDAVDQSNQTTEGGRFVGDYADIDNPDFESKAWVNRYFTLEATQAETVDLALKRAKDLVNNPHAKKGNLISLICLEFLSYADWRGNDELSKLQFIAKIEKALGGLRLVAVNDEGRVVYGLGALEYAAQSAASAQESDDGTAGGAADDSRPSEESGGTGDEVA
jgi:hypothetical protein